MKSAEICGWCRVKVIEVKRFGSKLKVASLLVNFNSSLLNNLIKLH